MTAGSTDPQKYFVRRYKMKKNKGHYSCSSNCKLCEGAAYVEAGMKARFNARLMEIEADDIMKPCENAEFVEYDYESAFESHRERRMMQECEL